MSKKAVLLVNLGSPASPAVPDVRRFLGEFLMDKRVLDLPWPLRFGLVHFCILPTRPAHSAAAYQKIWRPAGSPLVVIGQEVRTELEGRLGLPVELAMRYPNSSVPAAIARLRDAGVDELLLIPLFPHYAMSSYETAVEHVRAALARLAPRVALQVIEPFYDDPDFIKALVASATPFLRQNYDHLLISFHGLPERHLRKTDPTHRHCLVQANCCDVESPAHRTCYRAQCFKTVGAFVKMAGVTKYSMAFQSRLGRQPWIKPYTDEELHRLAADGVKRLLVLCPAFVADCLETLEEIGLRARDSFLQAGGHELVQIPCLNDHPLWLDTLAKWANRWQTATPPPA
jgi:protoporphyrin/coproporphyrin ferrochelatase